MREMPLRPIDWLKERRSSAVGPRHTKQRRHHKEPIAQATLDNTVGNVEGVWVASRRDEIEPSSVLAGVCETLPDTKAQALKGEIGDGRRGGRCVGTVKLDAVRAENVNQGQSLWRTRRIMVAKHLVGANMIISFSTQSLVFRW